MRALGRGSGNVEPQPLGKAEVASNGQLKPKKGGRPTLPPEVKQNVCLRMYVTASEADEIYRYVLRRGVTFSSLAKDEVFKALKTSGGRELN